MRNPRAIDDNMLDKIEQLLTDYESALEDVLYKHFNPTADLKLIEEVRRAIMFARFGETDEELLRSFEEFPP